MHVSLRPTLLVIAVALGVSGFPLRGVAQTEDAQRLSFRELPRLPGDIGVAGPIVGTLDDVLIVAGGANFAKKDDPQLWDLPKRFLDDSWLLQRTYRNGVPHFHWHSQSDFRLTQPVAYASAVSTELGILCLGGENQEGPTARAFLIERVPSPDAPSRWSVQENDRGIPDLPLACTAGAAALVGDYVYVVAGQVVEPNGTKAASRMVWRLNLKQLPLAVAARCESSSRFVGAHSELAARRSTANVLSGGGTT